MKNIRKAMYFPGKVKSFEGRTGKVSDLSSSLLMIDGRCLMIDV